MLGLMLPLLCWAQDNVTKLGNAIDQPIIRLEDDFTNITCPKPTYIHPSNLTHNSISFSWLPLKGVTEYIVYYRAESWSASLDHMVNGTFYRLDHLLPNTRYEFQLQAVCNGLYSEPYFFHIKTKPIPICEAPEKAEITHSNSHSAKITWKPVEGVAKYKVNYRSETEDKYNSVVTPEPFIELLKLTPNTLYEAKIFSVSGTGNPSDNSAFLIFRTLPEYLLSMLITPTELNATNLGSWTRINWSTLQPASRFVIHVSRDNGKTFEPYATVYEHAAVIPNDANHRLKVKIQSFGMGNEYDLSTFSDVIEINNSALNHSTVEEKNTEISSSTLSASKINVYPNPARDVVHIKLEENYTGIYEIAIEDATGKLIFETIVSGRFGETYFTLPAIAKGIYQMRVRAKKDIYRTKLLVD